MTRPTVRSSRLVIAALFAILALSTLGPSVVRANGVPVPVSLSYIDLSNWGPQDATGDAELIFAEGIVRLQADGLPTLTGELYQAWLVNSEAGDAISIGRFNSVAGQVSYEGVLPPISDFGFDLLIITVEPEPDDVPQPSGDRSIGGYFSLVGQALPDGNSEGASLEAPGQLPNTGAASWTNDLLRFSALMGAMALSVVVGIRLSRRPA